MSTVPHPSAPVLLSVRSLHLDCKGRGEALSFELREGECLVVLGANGTGKSLLLSMVAGLHASESGTVTFAPELTTKRRRSSKAPICWVPDEGALLSSLTLYENMALVMGRPFLYKPEEFHVADALLRFMNCRAGGAAMPADLGTADRRSAALAVALAGSPQVLLCDEPTRNLSPDRASRIVLALEYLLRVGLLRGMILTTQDAQLSRRIASSVMLLQNDDAGRSKAPVLLPTPEAFEDLNIRAFLHQVPS